MRIKFNISWQAKFGMVLIALSVVVYFIHYLIFRDAHHIFLYLIGDIAFVFIEVLLVTIVIHELLHQREKQSLRKKMNMVIGSFFSEVGYELIKILVKFDPQFSEIAGRFIMNADWSGSDFAKLDKDFAHYDGVIDARRGDLSALKEFLVGKRHFLLMLLENPNLLEQEHFTNLLWAVFHLTEELAARASLVDLPDKDYEHLGGDIKRVYMVIVREWLSYMLHLKHSYPYLFSLASRTNPFDANARAEIR